jgi:hypothetical protein
MMQSAVLDGYLLAGALFIIKNIQKIAVEYRDRKKGEMV